MDDTGEPAKKGGGGLCNMTRSTRVHYSCNKTFLALDLDRAYFKKLLHEIDSSLIKNTTSEKTAATLKWEGVFG